MQQSSLCHDTHSLPRHIAARQHLKLGHLKSPSLNRDSSFQLTFQNSLRQQKALWPLISPRDGMLCFTGCTPQDGRIHSPIYIGVGKGRRRMEEYFPNTQCAVFKWPYPHPSLLAG